MRLLLCLDGTNAEQLVAAAGDLLALDRAALRLLHVLDSGRAEQVGFFRDRYVGRSGMGSGWHMQLDAAARARGEEIVRDADTRLAALLTARPAASAPGGGVPGSGVAPAAETLLLAGRPEREIVRIAGDWPATLIALCARRQDSPPQPPGPHSVGHVARFVVDHAPCPVLLIRR